MFKADWEKTSVTHQLPPGTIEQMVRLAFPEKKLISHQLIAGGCANLNIKILLEDEELALILRVYLRDKDAAYREQKLAALLKQTVPVPLTYHIGEVNGYHFAITEFMPGISLRDLLLGDESHDPSAIMQDVGTIFSNITTYEFQNAGFFDKKLSIIPLTSSDDFLAFAKNCLESKSVLSVLTPEVISKISYTLDKYGHLFPNDSEKHLVHGDFDPANILVDRINGIWKITGVLDWEFSFSGSALWDIANMLRYAHQMPAEFQNAFLKGLKDEDGTLPENWRIKVHLLNLLALLDCLKRSDPSIAPKQCIDICELIDHILSELCKIPEQAEVAHIGTAIHRPVGPWTKQVHALLRYLRTQGFNQAPEPLGFDDKNQEIVSFVKGQTCDYPLSEDIKSPEALISSAKLLRAYHDASQHFLKKSDATIENWMFPCRNPQEVICHNDFAPYNICFDSKRAIGIIDFDTAHPGPRAWDIAYALYRFAPFTSPENEDGFGNIEDQIARGRLFLDAYGLAQNDRIDLVDLMIERLQTLLDFLIQSAKQGNMKYQLNMREEHHLKYLSDISYIKLYKNTIQEGLKHL